MDPTSDQPADGELSFDMLFDNPPSASLSSSSSAPSAQGTPTPTTNGIGGRAHQVEEKERKGLNVGKQTSPDRDMGMKFGQPDENDVSMGLSMSAPQSGAGARRRTRSRKRTTTLCKNDKVSLKFFFLFFSPLIF